MEQDFKVCAHFQARLLFLDRTEITLFKIVHFSYTEPWCSCLAHPLSERSSFNSSFFKTLCSWLWTEGLKNRWVEHTSSHHDLFTSRKSKYGCLQQFRALREYLHIRRPPYLKLWPWAVITYMCDRITASICDSVTQTEGIHWTTEADTERSKKAVSRQQSVVSSQACWRWKHHLASWRNSLDADQHNARAVPLTMNAVIQAFL